MGSGLTDDIAASIAPGTVFADMPPPGAGTGQSLEKAQRMTRHGVEWHILP